MTDTPPLRPEILEVLGSGTSLPTADRGPPGYLLRFADGSGVLLDPGPGSVRAAARAGCFLTSLRAVLITHFHVDHVLDLFALLFGLRNPELGEPQLVVAGPRGTGDLYEAMGGVFGNWVRLPEEQLRFEELAPGPFCLQVSADAAGRSALQLEGEAVSMPHLGHSLGYRLKGSRRVFAYSGDTGDGTGPRELGRGADLYVLEAALVDGSDTEGHLTPEAAGRVARDSGCRELVLTHLYPNTAETDVAGSARRHFDGPVTVASDGLRLPV